MKGKLVAVGSAAIMGTFAIVYARGTSCATSHELRPGKASCALVCRGEEAPEVQCRMDVDRSPKEVESVIADYDRFPAIFRSTLWQVETFTAIPTGDARFQARGSLWSVFGSYPIDIQIAHERAGDHFRAVWTPNSQSAPDENAGAWEIAPGERGGARITYRLSASAQPFPQFLVNNALLLELPEVLSLTADALEERGGPDGS